MNPSNSLSKMLKQNTLIMAPGAYDALTAKIIEAQGFQAVYMTGYGISVAQYGLPDLGFLTMTEMVENASRITNAINIPLIADADTGYGNPMNVVRTIKEYEKAGVSAIHIEDQTWPKRCGHMAGKSIIEVDDMVAKIKAAVDARVNQDFLIIARTDAIDTNGFDHAIERAEMYSEAGADIIFVEAPVSVEQIEEIPKRLPGKKLLINFAPRTPIISKSDLEKFGYAIAVYPGVCLAPTITSCTEEVQKLHETGIQDMKDIMPAFKKINEFLKVPYYTGLEEKYKSMGK